MCEECFRCGLTVPESLLVPVRAETRTGARQVEVCKQCEKIIKVDRGQDNGK